MPRKKKTEFSGSIAKGTDPEDTVLRQDIFLSHYSELGSIRAASEASGMSRSTPHQWVKDDKHGFAKRFEDAKHDFREMLQDLAVNRVKAQGPKDNPVLLITLLNAHWAEKYRPKESGVDETAKDTLKVLREKFKVVRRTEEKEESPRTPEQQVEDILRGKKSD